MFIVSKDNIDDPNTLFKFSKLVECITVLQSFGFIIYGSCVYEYIWRCASACLPWRKFSSLRTIVKEKKIQIKNINAFFRGLDSPTAYDIIEYFRRIAHVEEWLFHYRLTNFSEFFLTFDNPTSTESFIIGIELANSALQHMWACDDLMSLIALDKNKFILFKEIPIIKNFLQDTLGIAFIDFEDPQVWGVIQNIGACIVANETVVISVDSDFYARSTTNRIRALLDKGYKVTWKHKNMYIYLPCTEMEEKCAICLDVENHTRKYSGIVTLPCQHSYHLWCILQVAIQDVRCPLCRAIFDPKPFRFL